MAENEVTQSKCTDGPIYGFAGGWALFCFVGEKGHYWVEVTEQYRSKLPDMTDSDHLFESLCGVFGSTDDRRPALAPGNWGHCKNCERKLAKQPQVTNTVPPIKEIARG